MTDQDGRHRAFGAVPLPRTGAATVEAVRCLDRNIQTNHVGERRP